MAVSEEFRRYVEDQLAGLGGVVMRRMFGGVGIYFQDVFFALIADDVLYFKVDDANRADHESAGMGPFQPWPDKPTTMSYYEVPAEVLERGETLRAWADKALAAAGRAKGGKKKPRRKSGR
jgi:DNA transformation protein